MLRTINQDNTVTCVCDRCGQEFTFKAECDLTKDRENTYNSLLLSVFNLKKCEPCSEQLKKEHEEMLERKWKAELEESLPEREEKAGFPEKFRLMQSPFIRKAAEFYYRNRKKSLIISGKTGTGKTSSALFVLGLMMKNDYLNVKYCTWHSLVSSYVRAKTSNDDSEEAFLARLGWHDYIVIDELVGKKGDSKLSDSSQEFLFNIVDGVYSEARKAKVWILGNFFDGSLDMLVSDVDPLKRRLRTSFKPAVFELLPDESDVMVDESVVIQ